MSPNSRKSFIFNDKELADAVVALGVVMLNATSHMFYFDEGETLGRSDYKLVRDWRVAGALMEMMSGGNLRHIINNINLISKNKGQLPRAIIEACVEALQETGKVPPQAYTGSPN